MNRKQFYSKSGWFGSKDLLKASGSDWGIIATALRNADWDLSDSDIARAHEIADSLDNIEKKNLLGDFYRRRLGVILSYDEPPR